MLRAFSSNQMAKNNFPRTKARIACALSLAALFAFDAGGDGARAGFLEELFGLGAPQQAAQVPQPSGKSDRGRRAGRGSRIQSSLSYMPKARRHVAKNAGEKVAGVRTARRASATPTRRRRSTRRSRTPSCTTARYARAIRS